MARDRLTSNRPNRAISIGPIRTTPSGGELTDREREVLALVGRGLTNRQIAVALGIREGTVKAHLTSVFSQLGVQDRTSAALWGRSNLPGGGGPAR